MQCSLHPSLILESEKTQKHNLRGYAEVLNAKAADAKIVLQTLDTDITIIIIVTLNSPHAAIDKLTCTTW
jgi:hypothetical protein